MQATPTEWQRAGTQFEYRGFSVFFRDSGPSEKPVLLLIHGFPTASWDWHAVWDALAERFRLIAPDMIGFGFSARPLHYSYSIADQADLHSKLCRHLGVRRLHVLAHDYGVSVAQELLARDGEWIDALQLQSVTFLNGGLFPESHRPRLIQHLLKSPIGALVGAMVKEKQFAKSFAAIFGPNTQPSPEQMRHYWQLSSGNGGQQVMHKLIGYIEERKQFRDSWLGAMRSAAIPLRVINGPEDPVSGQHMVDRYRELIANADVVSLPGIGHYPQVEAPAATVAAFLEFQDRLA